MVFANRFILAKLITNEHLQLKRALRMPTNAIVI